VVPGPVLGARKGGYQSETEGVRAAKSSIVPERAGIVSTYKKRKRGQGRASSLLLAQVKVRMIGQPAFIFTCPKNKKANGRSGMKLQNPPGPFRVMKDSDKAMFPRRA